MKMAKWLVIVLVGLGLGLSGCKQAKLNSDDKGEPTRTEFLPAGTAGSLIEHLASDLRTTGYSQALSNNVVDYATAQVKADGTGSTTDYGAMLASIQTGSASAVAQSSSSLSTDDEKTTAIGVISGSLAATLSDGTSSASYLGNLMGADSRPNNAFTVTVDASSDYSSYLETLMTATIGTMDEAGMSNAAIQANSGTLVEAVMTKLSRRGTTASPEFLAAALGGITAGAIAGIDDSGVGSSDAATVSETLLSSVMGKVSAFGFTSTHLENTMEKLASKAVSALGKSGVPSASASAAAQSLMQTMVTKLTTAGVSSSNFSTVMQKVSEQGVANLGNAGVPAADRTTAVESLVSAISAKVKAAGVSDSDLSTVMAAIAQGAVSGTGSLGLSDADKQTAIANASSGALAGLKTAGYSTTQISNVSGSVTTGATKGLTRAGVSSADQSTFAARIQTGAEAGLSKAGLSSAEVSALSATLQTGINSGLATIGSNTLPGTSTSTSSNTGTTTNTSPSSAKAFTAFSFTSATNSGLSSNVTGLISGGGNISLTVPYGTTVTALKASFTTTGSSVTVGGTAQTSGVTTQDFTSPVTYKVTAADGTSQNYTVTVTVASNTAKAITAFSFTSALNSGAGITADVTATISGTRIYAMVPMGATVTALKPSFTTSGASVTVSGVTQTSGSTASNFTNPLTYRVTAADGSTQDYSVKVNVRTSLKGIPDTGQTTCWDGAGSVIACPTAGSALAQDGSYNTTYQPSYTDNGNGTVTDNVTGLVWQKASTGTSYTWANALTYCSGNTAALAGTGWRLPTKMELSWIVRNEGAAPTINTTFTGTVSGNYWSSTTYALNSTFAWVVYFYSGDVDGSGKSSGSYVRCVR
ncbi:MAG: hypothetical protein A2600_04915 [Candidatus Lambdaproteobacteria bacterium RIFOXYD1_FULL_56_27]|uniref:Lcl C-terminal domain-containing protein n=1 Tax=Candidatus Lambdaproteobacteria bacterium RIFOXYD2_FULL_56_26 TaxID=1817773 RepID=A0A1F6GS64_9PROT|nr:MAG: hypothetical protein A2426_07770 [Candidatus Lambdaproteobacteria bacterium RIFOXYC1_FULL_56_13]OGH00841.1 MAG: hypothetical protein A2557_03970 [Candidatus Lambdaproteobacteria bacterium RIFOXYD2_FULL_56_26]OGH09894.1 MAG: hypothetical protein A2600_04915 [Candidatus Lambdaproteobacteria bacterium RIFOXYD1_FULL_56_27]